MVPPFTVSEPVAEAVPTRRLGDPVRFPPVVTVSEPKLLGTAPIRICGVSAPVQLKVPFWIVSRATLDVKVLPMDPISLPVICVVV